MATPGHGATLTVNGRPVGRVQSWEPFMHPQEEALWKAVAANPADALPRLVLADWMQEHGRDDEADALRATVRKVPALRHPAQWYRNQKWYWLCPCKGGNRSRIAWAVYRELSTEDSRNWFSHRFYPTAEAAVRDLCRAWVSVHRPANPKAGFEPTPVCD